MSWIELTSLLVFIVALPLLVWLLTGWFRR